MADCLDDFFAKKAKSQKGKKQKYTTSTTILKKIEENTKQVGQENIIKKEKPVQNQNIQSINVIPILQQEEDDWKQLEEQKEIDLTGLRIQPLNIGDKDEKDDTQSKENEDDKDEDSDPNTRPSTGPWKLNQSGPVAPEPRELPVQVEEPPKLVGAYRPPSARNASLSMQGSHRHNKKSAPEITSELHFPTLSSALDQIGRENKAQLNDRSFTSVKHGARTTRGDATRHHPQLDLENKYSALNNQGNLN